MSAISPAINIGIGTYGTICMKDLANNFCLRESKYTDYVSFHQLDLVEGMIAMHNYDIGSQNFHEYKLDFDENVDGNQDLYSWQLHNFISQAYNSLITLTRELELKVNFDAIHVNLIFAAYEIEHLELLKETILLINRLKKQGDFGEVRVKCFSILSDGIRVSKPLQEENIVKTLDTLVEIRKNYNVLSHNFILDDKNTQAVSLKVKNNYLGFAISEIIVALLRNEYAILGALPNPIGVISIGIGMVYFDKHYFNAFIKNRILESKIELEKIHDRETKISTSQYTNIVKKSLLPYLENAKEVDSLVENIQAIITPENFEHTLSCYEFLLANLLGQHDRVNLIEPIEADMLYSINDLIYWNLQQYVLTGDEKDEKGLLELKNYKTKLTAYNAKIRDDIDPSILEMTEEKQILENHEKAAAAEIKYYTNKTWRKNIVLNFSSQDIEKQIQEIKNKQNKLQDNFKTKNCIARFFARKKNENQNKSIKEEIKTLEDKIEKLGSTKAKIKYDLEKLYDFKKVLEKSLFTLNSGIEQIFSLKRKYQNDVKNLTYLDYEFLHNIISSKKLYEYETEHRDKLQINIREILNILFTESSKKNKNFTDLLDEKIKKQTEGIIDFNMTNYLLSEYKGMNLLKNFNFAADLQRLKQRSFPFFNAIPTYKHQSHYLRYFDNGDKQRTLEIQNLLAQNYAGSLPSYIHAESPNKFGLITLEVIDDLKSVVKYNNNLLRKQ